MPDVRRDFRQRIQNESPLVQRRVRHHQRGRVHYRLAKKKNVNVESARAFCMYAASPGIAFDLLRASQQLPGHELGGQGHGAIQEPGLDAQLLRLGLVEGGNRRDLAQGAKPLQRLAEVLFAVAQVRAQQ